MTTLLQSKKGNFVSGQSSLPVTFDFAVTPGSLLVGYGGTTASRTLGMSDNVNGSYNADITTSGGTGSAGIFSFPNTAAGTPTVTFTITGGISEMDLIIEEWSGVQTVTPLDKTATSSGATVNTGTGGTTATLSQANELCLSFMHLTGNAGAGFAAQSPFTPGPSSPNPSAGTILGASGYLIQASTAAVTCTFNWTNNQSFRSCTATYKTVQLGQIAPFYSRKYILFNT
jgi:hypothetical protein